MPEDAAGRLIAIVLEQAAVPGRFLIQGQAARTVGLALEEALGPHDLALVAYPHYGIAQAATADRVRLFAALTAPFQDTAEAAPVAKEHDCSPQLELMADIAESMQTSPRRKVLMYVGSRLAFQSPGRTCLKKVRERLFAALQAGNITVYTFDTRGLETLATGADRRGTPSVDRTGVVSAHLARQGNLLVLPDLTGGRGVQNTNAPQELVPAVLAETSHYYLLGIPADEQRVGTTRKIDVRVSRRDVLVQARQAYVVAPPPAR
jgi:VWFA-related protein